MVGLIVLDGWGYSTEKKGNAIELAKKPNYDFMWQNYPHTLLSATGKEVGLSWGELGSSEVGHLSIGSGRVIYQASQIISRSIYTGEFYKNSVILDLLKETKAKNKSLHLAGLVSSGGIHSHIDHLIAIFEIIKRENFKQPVFIHMFTDGRDTSPKSSQLFIDKIEKTISNMKLNIKIATVTGRYYAMDRDSRWERTIEAYKCLTEGEGQKAVSAEEAVNESYKKKLTDEFIKPTIIDPKGIILPKDSIIFFNFRPERMRQLVEMFIFEKKEYPEVKLLPNLTIATMMEYAAHLPVKVIFPTEEVTETLAEILSKNKKSQIHIAETEKYAHVTYFFDGWHPKPYPQEQWIVIPSPKIATYDKMPQMSASKITNRLILELKKQKIDFVLINYANADMVGHTGKLKPTIKAVEAIDKELGRLRNIFKNDTLIITADHGNAEKMLDENNQENTEHEINPVPIMLINEKHKFNETNKNSEVSATGILADIAPTILNLLEIKQPASMTGYSLLETLSK
ncbi:MAG: 2,3-bisphosphoglycerate-independent phosphoglycerate mutase [Patescibacteria group bacterium]|jgi:2,3-bisphosphoglycerate-independent phosphoglycerate mutase